MCAYASHGDTKHILLFPANPEECFDVGGRRPSIWPSGSRRRCSCCRDLDIGMNDWVCPRLKWDDSYRPDRGRVLTPASWRSCDKFHRYLDEDGDGVAARTLPGVHSEGRVLHARLGPQQVRRLHRDPGRVPGGHRPPAAQAPAAAARPSPRPPSACRPTRRSASSPSAAAIRRCARRSTLLARARHRRRLHAHARLPVRRRGRGVPGRARAHLRGRAEPRRAAAYAADARDRRRRRSKLRSMLRLRRLPAVAPTTWSTASPASSSGASQHAVIAETSGRPPEPAAEQARPHAARLRGRDVDAVRRLRPRLGHRGDRAGVLGAATRRRTWSPSCPASAARRRRRPTSCSGAHGFNSAHGRMPSIATGANAANRELTYIGISGDGDSLSIGLGQLCHAIRRNVEHALRHREQRRLRPDQGAVLGVGRRRLEEQAGRGEPVQRRSIRCCWR